MNIENEIQARVDFKFNELLTAVKNTAKANWSTAFQNNSQKHSHYWEAFSQMEQMLTKEMNMVVPFSDMYEQKQKEKRNKAISKIMERFCKPGERDYHEKERLLVSIIEECQK